MTRVLFVDDDLTLLRVMRMAFRRLCPDWRFVFVESASNALGGMILEPFDAIVTDLRMPGMDGVSLLALVQKQYPSTRRMVLTGAADEDTMDRARSLAHEILEKPCSASEIHACIDRLLGEYHRRSCPA